MAALFVHGIPGFASVFACRAFQLAALSGNTLFRAGLPVSRHGAMPGNFSGWFDQTAGWLRKLGLKHPLQVMMRCCFQ